jgi:D-sedoheptulose 7-phosphate isomerase
MIDLIKNELEESSTVLNRFLLDENQIKNIKTAAIAMVSSIKNGKKIISCGNGGSHCDAMHFAEELTGRYRNNRKPYAAIAISDPSHISCVSNDFGYEYIFSRFIEGIGNSGDCLLVLSTSGNSKNIINAIQISKSKGICTIALTGKDGGKISSMADIEIRVPHFGFADRIQEIHIKVIHILIKLIEDQLASNKE